MANIKFSQFTVGNTESDIDFVVGYKGANNIQISPTNLLAASLSGYLPLTGGTMTGDIIFNDGVKAKFGSSSDLNIYHTGTGSVIQNAVGNLTIQQDHNDGDIIFRCDDGSGGNTVYLTIDGSATTTVFSKKTRYNDNVELRLGSGSDFKAYHSGTNTVFENNNGHLYIKNSGVDKDIIFEGDNGSGGVAEYFKLDGSLADGTNVFTKFVDNSWITMGSGGDLLIGHQATSSKIENYTGPLYIVNKADDQDIIFQSDDGSGGVATYFYLDGQNTRTEFFKDVKFPDNVKANFGTAVDLEIYHNGTASFINNETGDLNIANYANDKDIRFFSDNGSGGVTEYFFLDGSKVNGSSVTGATVFPDKSKIYIGTSGDLEIFHNGSQTYIENYTGEFNITQHANDQDIIFKCDDGSGGTATYFTLDGSLVQMWADKDIQFSDNIRAKFGGSSDLQIYHNGTNSLIENNAGDFYISNKQDDGDIIFFCDDGSGGTTEYFSLDGGNVRLNAKVDLRIYDAKKLQLGNSADLQIYHNNSNDRGYIYNGTGDLYIENDATDGDIKFYSDDGSGGTALYFRIDGGSIENQFIKSTRHYDNVKAYFGDSGDLQIYHDGSNSYIKDTGTGFLNISSDAALVLSNAAGEPYFIGTSNGSTKLYHNNSSKLETTSTGIKITSVPEYADNTAAIAGGLTTGDVYRTGDLLKIVH